MHEIYRLLVLGLAVLVGSALPFVPTGEMVSGAAALAAHTRSNVAHIFVVTWLASVLGDTVFLLNARFFSGPLRRWLASRRFAHQVAVAEEKLSRNGFNAVVTGRLIPGGRTPVLLALGLSRYPVRRFVAYDLVACALWAGIYSSLGSVGGRIANHPVWAMVIAIAFAVSIGLLVQRVVRLVTWLRERRSATVKPEVHESEAAVRR